MTVTAYALSLLPSRLSNSRSNRLMSVPAEPARRREPSASLLIRD